ncbi:MFS transporter [Nocardiopsis suaedae]|uniref:MFS transporter n=1 Tax=Nocardiopsis suaedae TaxID=3018444 RepID=A0ABT4TRR9_9ACTN|nr:MFS transporter [Nocardiopsis suaedae]MDA2807399.1 hypothetical protein [Nocardiopsis suaedae]
MTTLRNRRPLVRYLAGAASARAGDEAVGPALLLAGLAATGSEGAAALLFSAATAGAALGGPVLGALLDRSPRPGRLLACALGLYALGAALIAAGLGRVPFGAVLAVAAAAGLAAPAAGGGMTSRLPRLVPATVLPRANSLDAITYSAAGLAGPAAAAAAAGVAGPWGALVAAMLLIAAAMPFARDERGRGVQVTAPFSGDRPSVPTPSRVAVELLDGLRVVAGRRRLARATAATTLSLAAGGMVAVCWPLLGAELLGAPERGTLMLSVAAVSAIGANALLARSPSALAPDTLLWVCGAALCTVPLLAACARTLPPGPAAAAAPLVLALAAVLTGAAEGPQLTALFAVRHRDAPTAVRARVFTLGAGLKISGMAAGAAIAGVLAERGTGAVLAAAAGTEALALAAFAALTLLHPDRSRPPTTAHNGQESG